MRAIRLIEQRNWDKWLWLAVVSYSRFNEVQLHPFGHEVQ
jgi:hypothetical protein